MNVYFLRHADAIPGDDDDARPLSKNGRDDAKRLGQFLTNAGVSFDAFFTSPLVRARETTDVLYKYCAAGKGVAVQEVDALRNGTPWASFHKWLKALPDAENVLLVGHEPSLSDRFARLLGAANSDAFKFPKGAVGALEFEGPREIRLKCFIAPKFLRS